MKKLNKLTKFFLIFFALFLSSISLKAQFTDYYALIVAATDTGNKAEKAIFARLSDMGFAVTMKSETSVTNDDTNGSDLVIISATVSSKTVATNLSGLPTLARPVIVWEPFIYDFMGFQAADGGEYTGNSIKIVKTDHQLSSKFPLGNMQISSVQKGFSYGKPQGKPVIIATNPADTSQAVIFAYEKNDSMLSTTAPERRVGFFLLNDVADTSMSYEGWNLFDAAVYWSLNQHPLVINNNNLADNNSSNFPNPFNLTTDISFTVPSQSFVRLSIYNMLGERITTLTEGTKSSGNYVVTFNPSGIPGGTYIYKLEIGTNVVSKKMIYVK